MDLIAKIRQANRRGCRVYIIGNGGSYANAAHITNDLLSCGIKAFSLDAATLTCLANDFGWTEGFARWLAVVGQPSDLLIALSGSGKSPNILRAVEVAEQLGMDVWREFGAAQGLDMEAAEEHQLWLFHSLKKGLRDYSR
jgi:D-sedoheptulose 7-phosphate isomerase